MCADHAGKYLFGFPRLKRRGPIEASFYRLHLYKPLAFPRLKRRGPIEASRDKIARELVKMFPRLKRRGPIEAFARPAVHASDSDVSTPEKAWPH